MCMLCRGVMDASQRNMHRISWQVDSLAIIMRCWHLPCVLAFARQAAWVTGHTSLGSRLAVSVENLAWTASKTASSACTTYMQQTVILGIPDRMLLRMSKSSSFAVSVNQIGGFCVCTVQTSHYRDSSLLGIPPKSFWEPIQMTTSNKLGWAAPTHAEHEGPYHYTVYLHCHMLAAHAHADGK